MSEKKEWKRLDGCLQNERERLRQRQVLLRVDRRLGQQIQCKRPCSILKFKLPIYCLLPTLKSTSSFFFLSRECFIAFLCRTYFENWNRKSLNCFLQLPTRLTTLLESWWHPTQRVSIDWSGTWDLRRKTRSTWRSQHSTILGQVRQKDHWYNRVSTSYKWQNTSMVYSLT